MTSPVWYGMTTAERGRPTSPAIVGLLDGEGVGPDLIEASHHVLRALEATSDVRFDLRFSRDHGVDPTRAYQEPFCPAVTRFLEEVFAAGGVVIAGPGGGRFVYDMRRRFDLFCKIVPVRPYPEMSNLGRLRPSALEDVDIVIVRENASGIYFADFRDTVGADGGRAVEVRYTYSEHEVMRILQIAAAISERRRGRLAMVMKDGGLPHLTNLWRDCLGTVTAKTGVAASVHNIDYAAYSLVQNPSEWDVVVTSNLFGDVLADVSAVLLGSRGLSFSGNFAADGPAVYQTNHGAAHDLVGTDRANPSAQILTTAMMLRESFGFSEAATKVEEALRRVWRSGMRTADLVGSGQTPVGTRDMTRAVVDAIHEAHSASSP